MNECGTFAEDLAAYHDGELAAAARTALEQHLHGCAGCSAQLDELRALDGALQSLPRIAPSADFEARLQARLSAEASAPAAPGPRIAAAERAPQRPHRGRWLRAGSLASGLAAAAALLLWLNGVGSTRPLEREDWQIVADETTFDLLLDDDHELLYALDVLEDWDETPDPGSSESS